MKTITGDVTSTTKRPVLIPHVVNDVGAMGSGVAIALAKKWPKVIKHYKDWYRTGTFCGVEYCPDLPVGQDDDCYDYEFKLGQVQILRVAKGVFVANMVGQSQPGGETIRRVDVAPIRYESLRECMLRVAEFCDAYKHKFEKDISIDAPWFGTLRAGGDKNVIEDMISSLWEDFDVTMYDFEE